jgi:ubiquitin-protein ligase
MLTKSPSVRQSPRVRRLHSDWKAMQQLKAESSILEFRPAGPRFSMPAEAYHVRFNGPGLWKPNDSDNVRVRQEHEVVIRLGAAYPRRMPELAWQTPIFHPNISAGGIVCLGGYSTHWVPSLQLDELCVMLWDMIRYQNFDPNSPYNREAAQWSRTQDEYAFPLDDRPLRDLAVHPLAILVDELPAAEVEAPPVALARPLEARGAGEHREGVVTEWSGPRPNQPPTLDDDQQFGDAVATWLSEPGPAAPVRPRPPDDEIVFLDTAIVQAEIVDAPPRAVDAPEILFLE